MGKRHPISKTEIKILGLEEPPGRVHHLELARGDKEPDALNLEACPGGRVNFPRWAP